MSAKTQLWGGSGATEDSKHLCVEAGRRPTEELVGIATAARCLGARVEFTGLETRTIGELIRIVEAGGRWQGKL